MRILHYVPSLDASCGGPSACVPNQCAATVSSTNHVHVVYGPARGPLAQEVQLAERQGVHFQQFTLRQAAELLAHLRDADVLHVHGVWSPSCLTVLSLALALRKPIIVSPHGMLEPWALAHKALKKGLVLRAGVRALLNRVTLLQATAESEARNLRDLGLCSPIAVIANSVTVPHYETSEAGRTTPKRLLFLSRIHPKKGLIELVRAIDSQRQSFEAGGWRVTVAGPDEDSHWSEIETEARALGVSSYIEYLGPVYGDAKWALYRSASLFVLPTYSENFGLVIAEALGSGVPVVTTHGAPWSELETSGCGFWHPVGQEHLNRSLKEGLALSPATLEEMGLRGIRLVQDRYSAAATALALREMYDWAKNGGTLPTTFFPTLA